MINPEMTTETQARTRCRPFASEEEDPERAALFFDRTYVRDRHLPAGQDLYPEHG